jgi:ArsR family transcriptional regulator, arsenate/arsenite/antimonite-responsive transcriptional repressor
MPNKRSLTLAPPFDYSGKVETTQALEALAALAHGTRLQVHRLLVEAGPEGLSAGRISDELDLPPATLSFHLAHLARARLVTSRQEGRFVIYAADFQNMNALVGYLTENCCGGRSCAPLAQAGTKSDRASPTRSRRHT